ncbi:L-lactate dehydrogenase A-like 6B [Saguinus oedipus]|uniref:L-lactate dehydrogenase A-like 6B n=1 Tax=Saguinus oedipus TaxID=9490 RepID=A0ABQ9W4W0_SAGOE|nr:L-lactate dehydrogenase A-like 6B [Saguinus oedipus]
MVTVKCELAKNFTSEEAIHSNKSSIIGTGSVGMACALNILLKEHADSSAPVWSGVNNAGVPLEDLNSERGTHKDPEQWRKVHKEVITCGYETVKMKGYTNWATGLSVADLTECLLKNHKRVYPVSTVIKGFCGTNEVFLSILCILGQHSIRDLMKIKLSPEEETQLKKC